MAGELGERLSRETDIPFPDTLCGTFDPVFDLFEKQISHERSS
jgi:hypothetical protein